MIKWTFLRSAVGTGTPPPLSTYAIAAFRKVPASSRILHKSELGMHMVKYTYVYTGVQFKPKLQQAGTRSATA